MSFHNVPDYHNNIKKKEKQLEKILSLVINCIIKSDEMMQNIYNLYFIYYGLTIFQPLTLQYLCQVIKR